MRSISVVIPAYNSGEQLTQCLKALREGIVVPLEIIVVDDGSSDDTQQRAAALGATVCETGGRRGPGFARNLGSKAATGDVLIFLDADVCVRKDTVERIQSSFESDPTLDAIMGSYDRTPACWNFLSQYRNLMHAYVHQTGEARASTFWSGCGAVLREVFGRSGGFDERYRRPAIEDIELGYRLVLSGHKILLDRELQVTHLKRWSLWSIIKTDIWDRGVPWTELILRRRFMPNDLNLRFSQRLSVAVALLLAAVTGLFVAIDGAHVLIPILAMTFLMLAGWWSELRNLVRPRLALTVLGCFVALVAVQAYSHRMYALVVPLILSPIFILIMRPSYKRETTPAWSYWLSAFYIVSSLGIAILSMPASPLLAAWIGLIALLLSLNARFYLFLAKERRILFMLAAIPLHSMHHFYNAFSFLIGLSLHGWAVLRRSIPSPDKQDLRQVL
jgi:glycosyltransferase involved in cell wall biosynthesis